MLTRIEVKKMERVPQLMPKVRTGIVFDITMSAAVITTIVVGIKIIYMQKRSEKNEKTKWMWMPEDE